MRAWIPWLAAFIVWNLTFDYQLRRAGDAFVAEQLSAWARQQTPSLIRDAYTPRVRQAGLRSTALATVVLAVGVVMARRRARRAQR